MRLQILIIALIGLLATFANAQDNAPIFATATPAGEQIPALPPTVFGYVDPESVFVQAEDGTLLAGDFYLVDPLSPTVILLHQLYTTRLSWEPMIQPLIDNHYNVLAVDLRGFGESSSGINWHEAVVDVQLWFDWLRTTGGVRPDAISTMGSSMGSTLAIIGCANDSLCKTAIAISPGWDYYGIEIEDALTSGLSNRPLLILYAERDRWPAIGMPMIIEAATGVLTIETFPANSHGIDLIKLYEEDAISKVLEWLALYSGQL